MKLKNRIINWKILIIVVLLLGIFLYLFFDKFIDIAQAGLFFVDSARYSEISRNYYEGNGFTSKFTFPTIVPANNEGWASNLPPLHIFMIAIFFRFFGVDDQSVILTSVFFYLASAILVYLLARKLFSNIVALFSAIFYLLCIQFLNYAKDGASEPLFVFILLLVTYLMLFRNYWILFLSGLLAGILFFTKLQAFLFVPIFITWALLIYWKQIKYLLIFFGGLSLVLAMNKLGLLFGDFNIGIPWYLAYQQTTLYPGDNLPRSLQSASISSHMLLENIKTVVIKILYNLYNFFKLIFGSNRIIPELASPVIVYPFLLSIFLLLKPKGKNEKNEWNFRVIVLLMLLGSFVLAAVTSPNIRYVHQTIPFMLILAVDFIARITDSLKLKKSIILTLITILFFILPFIGTIFLDSRFEEKLYNFDKPYAHKVLGEKIGQESKAEEIVVTNLDSWGSWYGERKTILIPTEFNIFEDLDQISRVDKIFLTDFQKSNEDHPLSGEWDYLFNQNFSQNQFVDGNFTFEKVATISAQEVYENQEYTYKIWVRTK